MSADKTLRKTHNRGGRAGVIYQIRISLPYIVPVIWRRLEVPGTMTFDDLHGAIQVAMG